MTQGHLQDLTRSLYRICLIAAVSLLVSACQTAPVTTTVESSEEPSTEVPAEATPPEPEAEESPAVVLCPEPEPLPVLECPPIPKPKPCPVCPTDKLDGKMLIGEVEKITISPPNVTYTARIDTGATGTSIHATNIVKFERDGEDWVRFELEIPGQDNVVMEREVVRRVRVKQVELDEFERRLKVMLNMTIGSHSELVEFSLNDRSEMEHPILLGRNFLRNNAIVDVGQEFIAQ